MKNDLDVKLYTNECNYWGGEEEGWLLGWKHKRYEKYEKYEII
jgi:hypothetical protein